MALGYRVSAKTHSPNLALIPGGMADEMLNLPGISWLVLDTCILNRQVDGVVVDLHQRLSVQWVRFISNCTLKRIPVFHAAVVFEGATGRVSLSHLSEGVLEDFELSPVYMTMKRAVDVLLAGVVGCISLPFLIPLMVAIRLDSHGPVFFMQERVSQGGRPFRMIKFRTMKNPKGGEKNAEAKFATDENARITKLGRFLRRYRLDELPQVLNILRGDMSFIGPRPEQIPFVQQFEKEISFYCYRHLVKPGLTGWAQVTQGYAAGTDQTRAKLEHDLYYIKYFSFWLDLWILGKTLRTVITGFGAR
jgi:exopolysaccharide biosynthesis polyprenyl glycosylphosphotransferase